MVKLTKIDLVTLAVVVLVPAGAYLGYFRPHIAQLEKLDDELASLQRETADEYKVKNDAKLARKTLESLTARLNEFVGSITSESDAHNAVGGVVQSAKDSGVAIEQIKPGAPVVGKALSYLPIHLTATAPFPGLYDFLLRVERSKSVLTIDEMQLESDPLSDQCAVKLVLRIYFVKTQDTAEKGERS